jgi:putative transposase
MSKIRRFYIPGTSVFITTVCHNRKNYLKTDLDKQLLLSVMREVKIPKSFEMIAYVIMDNHFHCIIKPENTYNFSQIMQSIKLRFTNRYKKNKGLCSNISIWQPRFWDHVIRNQDDMYRHIDYIHYNPVKHRYDNSPFDYPWSSFRKYVDRGDYPKEWASFKEPENISGMNYE